MVFTQLGVDSQSDFLTTASLDVIGFNSTADTLVATGADFIWVNGRFVSIFRWITYSFVCNLIDIFGTATNVLNIACFVSQGFQDSVNISLLGKHHIFVNPC